MTYLELIKNKVEENREDIIKTLQALVQIPSEGGSPVLDGPFGIGPKEALEFCLKKAEKDGFIAENIDNMGGHIEYGYGPELVGILGHLDVVPAGDGWDHPAYGAEIHDGKIFGRGTIDNKGPVIAAYFGLKILKDLAEEIGDPIRKIRIILGLDEETNWKGIGHYFQHCDVPDIGFTPDSDFPVVNREMGILVFSLAKKFPKDSVKGLSLRSIKGGNAPNMVPDHCRAVVTAENREIYNSIKEKAEAFRQQGIKVNCKGIGKSLEITTKGVSAHGANPSAGVNAISNMMAFLAELEFNNEGVNDFIEFFVSHIGHELDGKNLGIDIEDEPSGKLIFNVGMINLDSKAGSITCNLRYPVTASDVEVYEKMDEFLAKYNIGVVKHKHQLPVYEPSDSPLVDKLMAVYKDHTGDTEAEPKAIGGGTYARACKNVLAFGPVMPGAPEVEHQPNEYIEVEELIKLTEIYSDAIYRLAYLD